MSAEPVKDTPAAEPVVAPATETKPEADAPAVEATTGITEAAATAPSDLPKEEDVSKTEVKVTAEPVTEGTLGYKAPGLIKSLRFSKKFFYLGEEAIDDAGLAVYLRGEKSEAAHANAAFASQTGKGLLLFAKRAEDKAAPTGILNLAEATEIAKEDPGNEFSFKLNGQRHTFQASSKAERDGWLVSIEQAATEAKANADGITSSEGYKSKHAKFTKPAGALVAAPAPKAEDKVHDGAAPAETTTTTAAAEPAETEKAEKDAKSRSRSRKRQSIFGSLLNKAEEKKEAKKEETAEKKEEKKEEEAKKEEETPVVAAATEEAKPAETPAAIETSPAANLKSKRGSVFGNLFKPKKEEKKEEAKEENKEAPAPTEPVPAEAPQLDPVDTSVPTETAKPVEGETAAPAAETETPVVAKEATTSSPKKESKGFFGFLRQKEAEVLEKKEEKKEEKAEKEEEKKEEEAKKEEETTASPTEAKEKRRSSFFGTLGSKKEKKSEAVSDAENTDGEKKSNLKSIFRKGSRSVKPAAGPATDANAPPTPAKDAEPTVESAPAAGTVEPAAPVPETDAPKPAEPAATTTAPVVTASA